MYLDVTVLSDAYYLAYLLEGTIVLWSVLSCYCDFFSFGIIGVRFRFFEVEVGLYLFLFYDLCNRLRLTFILNICFMQIGSGFTRFVNKRLLGLGWALVV